jgi:segregation and condensation protein B
MADNNIKSVLEAMLFSSDRPLTIEQMRYPLDNLEAKEIRRLLEELQAEYETTNRGMRIVEIAGGFQMTTPADFAQFLRKLHKNKRIERLSKPALETLAIIAYKQPLTKTEVESLRNVNVDGVITSLLDKDLIRITGRKALPGRPHVFGTTKRFLEYFGLRSLDDLPKMEDFTKLNSALPEADANPLDLEPITEAANIENIPQTITTEDVAIRPENTENAIDNICETGITADGAKDEPNDIA